MFRFRKEDEKYTAEFGSEVIGRICEAMIRTNLAYKGLPIPKELPSVGADKVYVSDLPMYVAAGLRELGIMGLL